MGMNRRSFIAACLGVAMAPWVKSETPLDIRPNQLISSGLKPPVGIGPFRPEIKSWFIDWKCDKCVGKHLGKKGIVIETWSGGRGCPFPKGPIKAIPCRICGDMIEPVVSWI